jgi:CheY-like chemotaxis protein
VNRRFLFLLVDDDDDTRYLNRRALLRAFPQSVVLEATTVDDALAKASGVELAAVVTDHHLATGTGADFIAALHAAGAQCPIVMVTSSCDPKVAERAREAGADRVFAGAETDFVDYLRRVLRASA